LAISLSTYYHTSRDACGGGWVLLQVRTQLMEYVTASGQSTGNELAALRELVESSAASVRAEVAGGSRQGEQRAEQMMREMVDARDHLLHTAAHGDRQRWEAEEKSTRCASEVRACPTAVGKGLRIGTVGGLARGDREWPLNEGQIPHFRVVRVALGMGYNRVEGNRRASRNGLVSELPPEIPKVTIRNLLHRCTP
jgi:hypothetical protein